MNTFVVFAFQLIYFIACLHFFQWKGYYPKRYLKYLFKNKFINIINLILIIQIMLNLLKNSLNLSIFAINLIFFILNIFILILFIFKKKKIKFIFTTRIFRLLIIDVLIIFPFCFSSNYIIFALSILTPVLLLIFNILDIPKYIEDNKFLNLAISKLEQHKSLIKIGVTGSNGKTSVKEILNKLLSIKYSVVTTQKNQNTPKGAIIAINKFLTPKTQVFICEMGARQVGDIRQMCNLVNPNLGIITSVSPQHLESFKTEQNIYLTKKELPDYLQYKPCVYNLDNSKTFDMYNEKVGIKSGISLTEQGEIYASNIHIVNYQTYFDIHYNDNIYPCRTKLLGEHNVTNILLALNMALHLGVDINSAMQTIINLEPTPHRLQYIKSYIDIIDDSYNCSIDSAKQALKVLNQINKIKVVCTPGIVEGGKHQFNLNQQLSLMLNHVADIIIIVGKTNRKALLSKLNNFELINIITNNLITKIKPINPSKKLYEHNIKNISLSIINQSNKKRAYIVNSLNDAKKLFSKILNSNHILLLLNDLPDEYN